MEVLRDFENNINGCGEGRAAFRPQIFNLNLTNDADRVSFVRRFQFP